jgi:hypothetical protein
MIDIGSVARLLYEDPDTWRAADGTLYHPVGFRLEFTSTGTITVNGFVQGWWGRFVINRACRARERYLVEQYLSQKAERDLKSAQAEVDRIYAALVAPTDRG